MTDKILTFEEKRRLTAILSGLYAFTDEGAAGIRIFLESAGLERFIGGANLNLAPRTVAGDLIGRIEPYGELPELPGYQALGALLRALLETPELRAKDAKFVATLLVQYGLVGDEDYVASVREQYDLQDVAVVERQPEAEPADQSGGPPLENEGPENVAFDEAAPNMPSSIPLPQALEERFDVSGLNDLMDRVGASPGDFGPMGKSALARELVLFARRRSRTDRLLAAAAQSNAAFTAPEYLHVLIADMFKTQELAALCQSLSLDCAALQLDASGLRGYDHDRFIKEQRAIALQQAMAGTHRYQELVEAMGQAKSDLDLSAFRQAAAPPPTRTVEPTPRPQPQPQVKVVAPSPETAEAPGAENFDVRVGAGRDGRYPVEVPLSPVGEMASPIWQDDPLADADFDRLFRSLRNLSLDPAGLEDLGARMFAFLFPGEVGTMLASSLNRARERDEVLRIRLRIDPPELSRLPWEYCFHDREEFFALNPRTPIVRYSAQSFQAKGLTAPKPVRILVVTASPKGLPALNVEAETENIRQALTPLGDKVQLDFLHGATAGKLHRALAADYHILHFIGHGNLSRRTGEGSLALEDNNGDLQPLNATGLRRLFRSRDISLVVLNACDTAAHEAADALMGVAPSLVRAEVPAVVAMQFKVPDTTAALFSQTLYTFLADGDPLDVAVTEMRLAAALEDGQRVDWGTPVLFMRAPDGVIW